MFEKIAQCRHRHIIVSDRPSDQEIIGLKTMTAGSAPKAEAVETQADGVAF